MPKTKYDSHWPRLNYANRDQTLCLIYNVEARYLRGICWRLINLQRLWDVAFATYQTTSLRCGKARYLRCPMLTGLWMHLTAWHCVACWRNTTQQNHYRNISKNICSRKSCVLFIFTYYRSSNTFYIFCHFSITNHPVSNILFLFACIHYVNKRSIDWFSFDAQNLCNSPYFIWNQILSWLSDSVSVSMVSDSGVLPWTWSWQVTLDFSLDFGYSL